jgi:hypothetical protein
MSRTMIVGREHLVGAARDYDELMEMGAEHETHHHEHAPHAPHPHPPAPPPPQQQPAPPQLAAHPGYPHPPHHPHPPPPPGAYGHPHHEHHHEEQEVQHGGRRMRVVKEEPKNVRQFPIGFELANIAPGDEEDIEVKPQVLFRGERLAIAQSIARYFDVLDIKVGKDSQLAATGALTGEAFETRAVGVRMELDTAQPGIVITIRVQNTDTAPHDFKAVLYGAVLE